MSFFAAAVSVKKGVRFGTLEPETTAYVSRVEADGGVVVDVDYVDAIYKKVKSQGILANLKHWTSIYAGVKKDANGFVSKLYSLDLVNDATQLTASAQPLDNGNLQYDGNDFMEINSFPSNQFTLISVTNVNNVNKSGGNYLMSHNGSTQGWLVWIKQSGLLAAKIVTASGNVYAGDFPLTSNTEYIISSSYNKAELKIRVNGTISGNVTEETEDILETPSAIEIGKYSGSYLIGYQNEQAVFDVGLSDAENIELQELINAKHGTY